MALVLCASERQTVSSLDEVHPPSRTEDKDVGTYGLPRRRYLRFVGDMGRPSLERDTVFPATLSYLV